MRQCYNNYTCITYNFTYITYINYTYINYTELTHNKHAAYEILGLLRDIVPVWGRKRVVAAPDLPEERHRIFAIEWREPAQHDVENYPDTPHV